MCLHWKSKRKYLQVNAVEYALDTIEEFRAEKDGLQCLIEYHVSSSLLQEGLHLVTFSLQIFCWSAYHSTKPEGSLMDTHYDNLVSL